MIDARKIIPLVVAMVLTVAAIDRTPLAWAEQEGSAAPLESDFSYDPQLAGDKNVPSKASVPPPIAVERKGNQTNIHLDTESLITPYIGAVKPDAVPQDVRPLLSKEQSDPTRNYQLETGIGLNLSENAGFNLGYRIQNPPNALDAQVLENDPQGQVRFGLDIKIPFK